jgi:hypothetical protein
MTRCGPLSHFSWVGYSAPCLPLSSCDGLWLCVQGFGEQSNSTTSTWLPSSYSTDTHMGTYPLSPESRCGSFQCLLGRGCKFWSLVWMCVLVLEFPADQLTEKPATPVILAAQEVKIRRIMVQIQSRANSLRDPIPGKSPSQKRNWWSGSR